MSVHLLSTPRGRPASAPECADFIIAYAIKMGASDIHLGINHSAASAQGAAQASEQHLLRLRVFGKLQVVKSDFIGSLYKDLIQRIKVLAGLNLAESMTPQDGQIKVRTPDGQDLVLRVSTLPSLESEDVVIRIQKSGAQRHSLDTLQMSAELRTRMRNLIQQKSGMILLNGPAGSGKTTTIYSILGTLASPERKILTAEDPIEARLPFVSHTQVSGKANFAALSKAFMRQDADVIFIGEVRDAESAEVAIQLAQTGHLVLTTLHTRDSIGVISRLEALEVHPNLIATTLVGSLSQRLVPALCADCRQPWQPDAAILARLQAIEPVPATATFFRTGPGCTQCAGGVRGRLPIFELFVADPAVSELINRGVSKAQILAAAIAQGMRVLAQDALMRVYEGSVDLASVHSFVFGPAYDAPSTTSTVAHAPRPTPALPRPVATTAVPTPVSTPRVMPIKKPA